MSTTSKSLKILAWNVYIGNHPSAVRSHLNDILVAHNPEVAGLMEATRMYHHLGGMGYQVVQLRPRPRRLGNQPADADIAIMVRNDVEIIKRGALRLLTFWKGPVHGLPQDPKIYRFVKVKYRNQIWKIGVAHTPFGIKARAESRIRLVRWLKRTLRLRPAVLVLDANMSLTLFRETIAGPSVAHSGGVGVDLIAAKNSQIHSARNLGKHGSDHPAMLYTVTHTVR